MTDKWLGCTWGAGPIGLPTQPTRSPLRLDRQGARCRGLRAKRWPMPDRPRSERVRSPSVRVSKRPGRHCRATSNPPSRWAWRAPSARRHAAHRHRAPEPYQRPSHRVTGTFTSRIRRWLGVSWPTTTTRGLVHGHAPRQRR